MKPKIILCLAFLLSGASVFALVWSRQIKPGDQRPDILIHSSAGNYQVVLLPGTNMFPLMYEGRLDLRDGDKQLASCSVDGVVVTEKLLQSTRGEAYRKLPVGTKVFKFEVASNLIASSTFSAGYSDHEGSASSDWFYLKDFSDAALPPPGVVAADLNNHPLKLLLSKSELVVLGTITNEPSEFELERGVRNYICEFQVADVLKGDSKLKGRTISITIVRFEMGAKDKHPLIKKDGECILFLKADKPHTPSWVTADFWFGVQNPSPWMARELKRMAAEEKVEGRVVSEP